MYLKMKGKTEHCYHLHNSNLKFRGERTKVKEIIFLVVQYGYSFTMMSKYVSLVRHF